MKTISTKAFIEQHPMYKTTVIKVNQEELHKGMLKAMLVLGLFLGLIVLLILSI